MKKTFKLTDPKKTPERQADSVKHEIKKYFKRERNKKIPEGADFWDFDCKFGDTAESAVEIKSVEINKLISAQLASQKDSFYIEILAKPGFKTKKT